ncbi:MAG: DNA methyltransferase [Defluviicoccus sp.]|uniref:DNA methyltransferase n=1 Tax=Accumulibacter sp. TaxID=2053492 RepID=UPI0025FD1B59|nr:DNA methyltransferase [Accumulibacter sp.]MCM8626698.1 site-specific DNA-methyltransferase [Accumulibacter sp.]MDG4574436.1 DNA methyltransferase [Defluviicoccus sp.]MDG4591484.1 DNA methyltransferase [Defluviicoccus sp.]
MSGRRKSAKSGELFIEASGQLRLVDKSAEQQALEKGKVECLGLTFDSEDARRAYFTQKLREKLADPAFRQTPGFPIGTDEDIIRMSDPPWYTACPNPFLEDFVRCYGTPFDPAEPYARDPFAVDTSVGKTDALYKAHSYHTKVPHLAIVPSILHYTEPGDIVLDGFAGSGMTGVAAQWCGAAPAEYRKQLEAQWAKDGRGKPKWGARRAILNDLGPAATFIAANYTLPFDVEAFTEAAQRILSEVDQELGWMYETLHSDGKTKGRINYTVWSEVFTCPECAGEVNFVAEALDEETKRVHDKFPCPHCTAELTKDNLQRDFETLIDPATRQPWKRVRFRPAMINYRVGKTDYEKVPDSTDLDVLNRIAALALPPEVPTNPFPIEKMYHGSRLAPKGFTHVHHLFLPRAAQALAALWRKASAEPDRRLRNMLLFFVEQSIWGMSLLNRYSPSHFSQVNRALNGVYYVASQSSEVSPWYGLSGKLRRLWAAFEGFSLAYAGSANSTGTCARIMIEDASVDYIFTDPPFGENIYYADLNYLVEAWHRVLTNAEPEAIVDQAKDKDLVDYQGLMRACFAEYARVLKPGRWMTVVFSNSRNSVWRAIQEALGTAGFVVADVRTLDKQQGSYRQVTSSAVKQDLVISAYKPTVALAERFALKTSSPENAWAFVNEHLAHVPVFSGRNGHAEIIAERTAQMLHDRMVAFHVQRELLVPLSTAEFLAGLEQRYPKRDDMYFLPTQIVEYDRKRMTIEELRQLELFVHDEATAIQWLRRALQQKPRSFQDLQPAFMRELQAWAKHEKTIELKEMLRQGFLHYDGVGPVPSQIHSYLSTNFKELRNLDKEDPALIAKAKDRWYVPDPAKQIDLEKLREKALLSEFVGYKQSKERKIKLFRAEAVRAGFKAAYDARDYQTIVDVAAKLPDAVVEEDDKLVMYLDVARTRLGVD